MTSQPLQGAIAFNEIRDVQQTNCCIVGAGPAGAVLALLLARQGIPVTLLEAHQNFDREFRGDTIHASVMEIMDELGLADRLLQIPHTKIPSVIYVTANGSVTASDYSRLKTKYPYIMVLSQARFLEFITTEAKRYPNFQLVMGGNVQELIEEDGVIRGVRYRGQGGTHEVRSHLTVAADGRFSRIRKLASLEPRQIAPPMDILWFRLPRLPEDSELTHLNIAVRFGRGYYMAMTDRFEYWQIAYVIPKGSYPQLRTAGLEAFRQSIVELLPEFCDRVESLKDWSQVPLLSVGMSRVPQWYRPGLLLIGDSAHVMSTVAGVGINCAIQDAVVAANVLTKRLKAGNVRTRDLAAVQLQRELPTRIMQALQSAAQRQVAAKALNPNRAFTPPLSLRIPFLRHLATRLVAFGVWPVHVKN
jgi:2-polyprenyl-6-methoxyphenol hydroxylase-like FAD-dependent oxidoreductase